MTVAVRFAWTADWQTATCGAASKYAVQLTAIPATAWCGFAARMTQLTASALLVQAFILAVIVVRAWFAVLARLTLVAEAVLGVAVGSFFTGGTQRFGRARVLVPGIGFYTDGIFSAVLFSVSFAAPVAIQPSGALLGFGVANFGLAVCVGIAGLT